MARSVAWRRTATDAASWHQDQALNTTIFILRETGPTGFLLKEEGETKKFKVFLGDPHTCTCPTFMKEKDICKHISWILLKKFRVPRQNPVTWQLGLVEREINEILRGAAAAQAVKPSTKAQKLAATTGDDDDDDNNEALEPGTVAQRPISDEDVCPICQEVLLDKHLPVTYCRFGCGNNVHIKCMKVWAEHQQSTGEKSVKCPFCREDFGPFSLLQQEFRNTSTMKTRAERFNHHLGTQCKKCHACPIAGKCYKCTVCTEYHLCQNCFNTPTHIDHNFQFRERTNQRWRPASRGSMSVLPQAVIQNLMERDISDQDYDLLLQLDGNTQQNLSDLTEETVNSFPLERVRANGPLLAPGQQCRICLQRYQTGQHVRRLPCRHKFHKDCIDNWLLHQHATCPVDGTVYTNESVRLMRESMRSRQPQTTNDSTHRSPNLPPQQDRQSRQILLEIHGHTQQSNDGVVAGRPALNRRQSSGHGQRHMGQRSNSLTGVISTGGVAHDMTFNDLVLSMQTNSLQHLPSSAESSSQQSVQTPTQRSRAPGMASGLQFSPQVLLRSGPVVAPSIPAPHTMDDLDLGNDSGDRGHGNASNSAGTGQRKPPSGADVHRGRVRGRPGIATGSQRNNSSGMRQRSSSRDRMAYRSAPAEGASGLYIGHDPGSIAGITSDVVTHRKMGRPPPSTVGNYAVNSSPHRWGNVQEYSGASNDIVLSGNAVSVNDTV